MKNLFARFVREEVGQDMIEYSLLAAVISIAAISILPAVGGKILGVFTSVDSALTPSS